MEDCNTLVVASSERCLHFFTTVVKPFTERFHLYGMKDIPTCLAYTTAAARSQGAPHLPTLCIGDDAGDVFVLNFLKNSHALFKKTQMDEVDHIYWKVSYFHSIFISLVNWFKIESFLFKKNIV